jgi:hypothetical protein
VVKNQFDRLLPEVPAESTGVAELPFAPRASVTSIINSGLTVRCLIRIANGYPLCGFVLT